MHHVHECCGDQRSNCDIKHVANDLMQQNGYKPDLPLLSHEDTCFVQAFKDTISITTDSSVENNSLSNMDYHTTAVMSVKQILDEALDSIFSVKNNTYYSQEESRKSNENNCFAKAQRLETCFRDSSDFKVTSTLDTVYSGTDVLVSSPYKSPSLDKNCLVMPLKIQSNDMGVNLLTNSSKKEVNITPEKLNIPSSSGINKVNELMVHNVNSTSDPLDRESKLYSSILKGLLSGGDYRPPYLPNQTTFEPLILTADNNEMVISPPKNDKWPALIWQTKKRTSDCCQNSDEGVKNSQLVKFNRDLVTEKTCGHFSNELNCIDKETSSVNTIITTNTPTPSVSNATVKVEINKFNLIPTFSIRSSDLPSGGKLGTYQYKGEISSTQCDETVPSKFMNGGMQSGFQINREDPIGLLCNNYLTNDCDEKISLDLLSMFVVKRTKTVIEESFGFCDGNNIQKPKLQVNKDGNVANHQGIENVTIVSTTESLTSNLIPAVFGPILNRRSIPELNKSYMHCNEEDDKAKNIAYNNLFEISNSSWSDVDQIKENVNLAEKVLDKVVEKKGIIEVQPLDGGSDGVFATSNCDDDELDRAIDDSIKKYEFFTVDAGVLATPSTAEKSCQTEIEVSQKLAKCKRCLKFEEQSTEPMKKRKLNLNNEPDFKFPATINDCSFNDLSAHAALRDDRPTTESEQAYPFSSPANDEDPLKADSSESFPKFDTDEAYEFYVEESLYDEEDNVVNDELNWSNESTYDSDQEVPINIQDNQDAEDDDIYDNEATDSSSETEYFEALEELRNARKL